MTAEVSAARERTSADAQASVADEAMTEAASAEDDRWNSIRPSALTAESHARFPSSQTAESPSIVRTALPETKEAESQDPDRPETLTSPQSHS
jgi:hypothetical protein